MKAIQISEYGDPSVATVVDTEKPKAGEGQVVVEVHATSLNPFDSMVRSGGLKDAFTLPFTLGGDIAGVVTEVGAGVVNVKVGDEVYGQANVIAGNSGAWAEYACTKAAQVSPKPSNMSFNEAAAVPLTGVSALQALNEHLKLQSGQKIFIQGGAGNIGSLAAQLAKHLGAHVAATGSPQDIEYLKSIGVDEPIDFTSQKFEELLHDYDAVFDTVGGDTFTQSLKVLKRGGIGVSMIATADEAVVTELGVTALTQNTHVTSEALAELTKLIEDSVIKPRIDSVYEMDRVGEAFQKRETGKPAGKVVLEITKG